MTKIKREFLGRLFCFCSELFFDLFACFVHVFSEPFQFRFRPLRRLRLFRRRSINVQQVLLYKNRERGYFCGLKCCMSFMLAVLCFGGLKTALTLMPMLTFSGFTSSTR